MSNLAQVLYFESPGRAIVRAEELDAPTQHQVRVRVLNSAISPGTEMLFYRGQVPRHMAVDSTLDGMDDAPAYPMRYGYAAVGEVTMVGDQCDPAWHGKRVFAFQPHGSHFNAAPAQLLPVPDAISTEAATLFPNLETAVSLLHDSAPRVGERVVVFGQGIVGLLTTWLLGSYALEQLTVVDPVPARRARGRQLGADVALEPDAAAQLAACDPDLILELTGNPAALTRAIQIAGFHSRVIIGSWYGEKDVNLPLGHEFHRNRVTLYSSQVSTLPAALSARWDKARRYALVWSLLARLPYANLISHRFPIADAPQVYAMLDTQAEDTCQVLFTYA